jgi:protein SCO1/2
MTLRSLAAALVLATAAGVAPAANDGLAPASEGKSMTRPEIDFEQRLGEPVPLDLTFTDSSGRPVTLKDCVGGKPTILILAYYRCPMLCNQVLNGTLDALRALPVGDWDAGRNFNVVTVSFDPKEKPDLAAMKKQTYVAEYGRPGAEEGWRFLTGDTESIAALTRAVGFGYYYDRVLKEYMHASGIIVLTPDGKISRYFYGIQYDPTAVRLSMVEASNGKVGSLAEKILLMCYRYDHATGKYSADVMLLMRTAGALTVVVVVGWLVLHHRRERRKKSLLAAAVG